MRSNSNEFKIWRHGIMALLAATLALAACGEKPGSPPPKLFQQERDALDKTKSKVEQAEAQRTEDLKKEEERQTQ